MKYYSGGADADAGVNPGMSTGQWYKHSVKYDTTNHSWEWKVNNVSVASGAISAAHATGMKDLRIGSPATDATANTFYMDDIKVSSTGYPVAGSTGNTWKAAYVAAPNTIWAVDSGGLPHWGVEKADDAACTSLYDWFHDGANIYINSGGTSAGYDPDTLWSSVEASTRTAGIHNTSKIYVTIQDINVKFSNNTGIYLYRQADNNIVQRCDSSYNFIAGVNGVVGGGTESPDNVLIDSVTVSYNGNSGIDPGDYTTNWTISNNTVHHNGIDSSQSWPGGITLYGVNGGGGHIVEHNTVYNNGNATDVSSSGAIWIDRVDEVPADPVHIPAIVRYNLIYNNLINGIFLEKTSNSQIYYNIAYGNLNGANPINGLQVDAFVAHSASGNSIYNNVFYGNYVGITIHSDSSAENQIINNLFKNNVSVGNTTYQLNAHDGGDNEGTYGSGNVYVNNAFGAQAADFIKWGAATPDTYDAFIAASGQTDNNVESDPLFVSAAGANFTLKPKSPCIGAGADLGATYDDAIKPGSTWPSAVTTVDQDSYGSWEMGAYAFTYILSTNGNDYITFEDVNITAENVGILLDGTNNIVRDSVITAGTWGIADTGGTNQVDTTIFIDQTDDAVVVTTAGSVFYNNVIYSPTDDGFDLQANAVINNCIFEAVGGTDIYENGGTNAPLMTNYASATGDPLFVTPGSNFKIQNTSPCRKAGTNLSLVDDANDKPWRTTPDIGAYQNEARSGMTVN
jgi:parallel beta-helix repeat protein